MKPPAGLDLFLKWLEYYLAPFPPSALSRGWDVIPLLKLEFVKRLREHHGSTSPKNGRPEVATTTKKTNNFHQLSNFESSKLWYLFISIQLPLIHTSPIHSPSIRTGDVGEGRSVGTGTSLGDLGAELDIKAEASGGSCFTTLTISRFCTNLESHPIWGIFICIYIYIYVYRLYIYIWVKMALHLPTNSGECNFNHIHFENKIGGGKPTHGICSLIWKVKPSSSMGICIKNLVWSISQWCVDVYTRQEYQKSR